MQRERNTLDSFPEPIDLNQGSLPNNSSTDNPPSWDNMLDPVDNRISNYILTSRDANVGCANAANDRTPSFSGWARGESSSSANHLQDGDSKMKLGWSSSYNARPEPDVRSEDWHFEPSNSSTGYIGNQVNSTQDRSSLNLSSNNGHMREDDCYRGLLPHILYRSGHSEAVDQVQTLYNSSSSNLETSLGSSGTYLDNSDALGPSFGTWGSSCKRKALEGTCGQIYPGGASSSNQAMGKNIMQDPVPRNLTISSDRLNLSPTNHSEQPNFSTGVGVGRAAPGFFPSSSAPRIEESSARNFTIRSNAGRHDQFPYDTPRGTSVRSFGVYSSQQSRTIENPELRPPLILPANATHTLNEPHLRHLNGARGTDSYPWSGSLGSRGGSSSGSFMGSGERVSEVNVRSSRRHNLEYPMTVSAPETRNVVQDQIDWSFAPGAPRNRPSGPVVGSSSGARASSPPAWLPHQNQTSHSHPRLSEAAPWIPFPRVESDSGIRRSHFPLFPSGSSLPDEAATTGSGQHQLDQRSVAFLMDMQGDDANGWRAFAALEGRHRLIRQVLNAMRRGVHLQAEDYMLIDPFINGFVELHDRHRDMRLDVDNMSYEELLALEEQIGNVSTGLSEEKINGSMKQRKFGALGVLPNLEPCCICQEDYIIGDDMGILDCGHEFHTECIKQWLSLKNLCPICKMTALET